MQKLFCMTQGIPEILKAINQRVFFAENLDEKNPSVGSAFMKLEDFWVLLSGRLPKGPRVAPKKIHAYLYKYNMYIQYTLFLSILSIWGSIAD